MDKPRPCGCKGRRTCLICEENLKITQDNYLLDPYAPRYVYCPWCNLCYPGSNLNLYKTHPLHVGEPLYYQGIYVKLNFLSDREHDSLIKDLDSMPWDLSQSGRRKQNFGPQCNFKKRKLRIGDFKGFPSATQFIQDKFRTVPILENFQTIEQCSLEYDPKNGASIDPHVDDCWIWGERVVTVNLLSDSILTMTYNRKPDKYNLDLVATYPKVLDSQGNVLKSRQSGKIGTSANVCNDQENGPFRVNFIKPDEIYPVVHVPMPKNSLLVMYGNARYNYEHRILREDISERRVCLAYREFTPPYLDSGEFSQEGRKVIDIAKEFW